jgi:hypothetical protein
MVCTQKASYTRDKVKYPTSVPREKPDKVRSFFVVRGNLPCPKFRPILRAYTQILRAVEGLLQCLSSETLVLRGAYPSSGVCKALLMKI